MGNQYQNLVARFGKALQMDVTALPKAADNASKWIVLGYFDTLQIYPLDCGNGNNWISAMWNHNVTLSKEWSKDFYFHPLHMMSNIPSEKSESCESFWELPARYLFLSLVQSAKPGTVGTEAIISKLSDAARRTAGVSAVCYHTMELSDLVVVWKSDSLVTLLKELRSLYQDPLIGDMDTFVAINYQFLQNQEWKNSPLGADNGQTIYVSTRYVVRSVEQKRLFLAGLKENGFSCETAFFTTGMEDLHIVCNNLTVYRFLEFLHLTIFNPELSGIVRAAFSECATQIGLPDDPGGKPDPSKGKPKSPGKNDPPVPKNELAERCSALLIRFQDARKRIDGVEGRRETSWIKPVGNLYHTLSDMSQNCILDGFCYLILGAASAFCNWIEAWSKTVRDQPMSSQQLELVQRFVRGWGTLMEHSTRVDGRFIQMPGFSPALCEIPARLLEFYLAFANRCAKEMGRGGKNSEKVALLFVPKICRKMKVESIFLSEEHGDKHLLYMDIPFDMLYDPLPVMCCICHEIAHFVGGNWRCRDMRKQSLTLAVANELAIQLYLNDAAPVFEIYKFLMERCVDENVYLIDLLAYLRVAIKDFLESKKPYDTCYTSFMTSRKRLYRDGELSKLQIQLLSRRKVLAKNYQDFFNIVDNLSYLYQECYADVSMISLLNLNRSTYLHLAQQELEEFKTEVEDIRQDPRYYIIVERWSAVLRLDELWASQNDATSWTSWVEKEIHGELGAFVEDIDTVCNPSSWGAKDGVSCPLIFNTSESFKQLSLYLSECCRKIKMSCEGAKSVEKLQAVFDRMALSHTLDCDSCNELIAEYRKDLLNG